MNWSNIGIMLKKSEGNEPTEKFHGEERSNEDLEGQLQNYLVETTTVDKNSMLLLVVVLVMIFLKLYISLA